MKKKYLTWNEKKAIIDDALSRNNIRAAARDHGVQPAQIRRWKKEYKFICEQGGDDADKMKHVMSVKMFQKGPPHRKARNAVYSSMYQHYENLQEQQIAVSVKLLCMEYRKLTKTGTDVSDEAIRKRIARWLKTMKIALK
jgi:transposase-like protein